MAERHVSSYMGSLSGPPCTAIHPFGGTKGLSIREGGELSLFWALSVRPR